jgi:hypothetical protein
MSVPWQTAGSPCASISDSAASYSLRRTLRDARAVTGVDEVVEVHLREQQAPVFADAPEQAFPVELVAAAHDEVQDVRAVGAVSLGDEQPVPEQLLWRRDRAPVCRQGCPRGST